MMGKQIGQIQMVILDIDSMIPEDHLLRRIKRRISYSARLLQCMEMSIRFLSTKRWNVENVRIRTAGQNI